MKKNLQTAFNKRQYMISKDFEVYYYNDHSLSKVNIHSHTYYEIYLFLEGNVSMQIESSLYLLQYGDIILIPPHALHRAVIHNHDVPYRRFIFWISTEYLAQLQAISSDFCYFIDYSNENNTYVYHTENISFNAIQAGILRLIEEIKNEKFGHETQITICIQDFLLKLNRTIYEQNHPFPKKDNPSLEQNILLYIEEHLGDDLSLEQLAKQFYVNKYHISHIFKNNIGLSLHQYIIKKRLLACREAIIGSTSITDACQQFGFGDYSSFYRAFKKEYGISPKEFQNSQMQHMKANSKNGLL